jgi:CRISPR-associated endonuclease Csn1
MHTEKQMRFKLGLDIGIASIGWAVIAVNKYNEPCKIIARGVRVFTPVENPKDGSSLKAARREFRSVRRTLRRRKARINLTRALCKEKFNVDFDRILSQKNLPDIYEIRYQALLRPLSNEEFARLLLHFSHRRGFKSNRKERGSKENGAILKNIETNEEIMTKKGYKTIGEFFYKECPTTKHNKEQDYKFVFNRSKIEEEIRLIFDIQKKDFVDEYLSIFNRQRSYDEGPASGPYAAKSGSLYLDMLGTCKFDGLPRTYQDSAAAELFRLYVNTNEMTILDKATAKKRRLTETERILLIEHCLKKLGIIKYGDVRKYLKLNEDVVFCNLPYSRRERVKKTEKERAEEIATNNQNAKYPFKYVMKDPAKVEKRIFTTLKGISAVKKAFGSDFSKLKYNEMDTMISALHAFHDDEKLNAALRNGNFKINSEYIENVKKINLGDARPIHLSTNIIYKLLPHLQSGLGYSEAMQKIGINHSALEEKQKSVRLSFRDVKNEIYNPVVTRAISQTFKVVNAIVDKYGSPQQVLVEVSREMAKPFKERKEIEKFQQDNQAENERIKNRIRELYPNILVPNGLDIVKYRLAEEQDWEDPYLPGTKIDAEKLFEPNYTQIDHIIPYSISYDDSYNNKVLVLTASNQNKGDRTPLQFLSEADGNKFQNWVRMAKKISSKKKSNLLTKDPDLEGFIERNIKDTQYITRFIMNYLQRKFVCGGVKSVKGAMTSYFRKRFGLNKLRDTDEHHATDAIIIACFDDKLIQRISQYHKAVENLICNKDGELIDKRTQAIYLDSAKEGLGNYFTGESNKTKFPEPWENFREELTRLNAENPVSVSQMPNHKITGQAHEQTIRGQVVEYDENDAAVRYAISRIPTHKLRLNRNGEIENYYNKEADIPLYNAIKQVLTDIKDTKKLEEYFKTKFRHPHSNNIVRKVKIKEKATLLVELDKIGGVASNGNMVRIDVFCRNGKFYFVPIYVADFYKKQLPNRAVVSGKTHDEWLIMDETVFKFKFSLFPKDLVYIEQNGSKSIQLHKKVKRINEEGKSTEETVSKQITGGYFYFRSASISNASISVFTQNREWEAVNMGIQNLKIFKKMEIDVLGNISDYHWQPRNTKTLLIPKKVSSNGIS